MSKKRLQALGSFGMMRRLKGDVINLFSCLIGQHGGESNRLFLELHSRRNRSIRQSCIFKEWLRAWLNRKSLSLLILNSYAGKRTQ